MVFLARRVWLFYQYNNSVIESLYVDLLKIHFHLNLEIVMVNRVVLLVYLKPSVVYLPKRIKIALNYNLEEIRVLE